MNSISFWYSLHEWIITAKSSNLIFFGIKCGISDRYMDINIEVQWQIFHVLDDRKFQRTHKVFFICYRYSNVSFLYVVIMKKKNCTMSDNTLDNIGNWYYSWRYEQLAVRQNMKTTRYILHGSEALFWGNLDQECSKPNIWTKSKDV